MLTHLKDKSLYCAHHQNYGHATNDYVKGYTPKPPNSKQHLEATKSIATTPIALIGDQTLRMVPIMVGRVEPTEIEEKMNKQQKRTKERVKWLRSLSQTVNYVSAQNKYYFVATIVFT